MKYLIAFLMSMVPVIELRGSIPMAISSGINPWVAFALGVVGNMVPVVLVLLFVRRVFKWMKKYDRLGKIATKLENRANAKSEKVRKNELTGLCILVAIPLPGTGAWTGALIAAITKMRIRRALPTIFVGVVIAGLIVTLVSIMAKAGYHKLDFLLGSGI